MKVNKFYAGLLLIAAIAVHPTISNELLSDETTTNVLNAALPALAGLVGMIAASSPAGPFLVAGLGLVHVLSMILTGGGDDDGPTNALTKTDLYKTQKALMNKIQDVDAHVFESTAKIIRELTHTVESYAFLENMRNILESLVRTYHDKMPVVLDPKMSAMTRRSIEKMLDYESDYRKALREFITTYIKPTVFMPTSGPIKLFFDFVLQKDNILAVENQDCNHDSTHYKVYKSYIYLAKVLTDAYAMALAGHVIQFQLELKEKKTIDAESTKATAEQLLEEYKHDMKELMAKTKWALENSSRDIKNCGTFDLKEGVTYARLPFATTLPKYLVFSGSCKEETESPVTNSDYETDQCFGHKDLIPPKSTIQVYKSKNDDGRPYSHLKFQTTTIGHEDSSATLFKQVRTEDYCYTVFCPAYKKNTVGISTQRVRAERGNVITGVRMRVRNNILYIDIQQGKFLDELRVDPNSVFWTETPEDSKQVAFLSMKSRRIEIADHMLEGKDYLTALQFKQVNQRRGVRIVKLFIEGCQGPDWNSFGSHGSYSDLSNEISMNELDDPAQVTAIETLNLITSTGEDNPAAYVEFQPSSFEKDFGRTTIPYIDIREVYTSPPSPVRGISLYHMGVKRYGGFLSLKLVAPSLTDYIDYNQIEQFAKPEKKD